MGRTTINQATRIFAYIRQHKRIILWGLICLVVTDILGLIPPWLIKDAIDALPSLISSRQLLPYLGLILFVVSGQALFRFAWRRSLFGVSRQVEYELRNDIFRHLQLQDRAFFVKFPIGDLMSRSTNDLVAIQEFIAYFGLVVVDSCLIIAMALILMTIIDPVLTLAAMIPMPFLSVVFFYFGRRVRRKATEVQAGLAHLTHLVQESLTGVRIIQAYTLERVRLHAYQIATGAYIRENLELAGLRGLFYATLTFVAGSAAVIVLWVGGGRVIDGHLTLGGLVAFNSYLIMLTWPMMSLGFMVNLIQRGRASLDRLDVLFNHRPHITDPSQPIKHDHELTDLCFQDVGFRYPGSKRWALRGISLHIPAGSKIGITGPVGGGKTTLLELVTRIFDPKEGGITLDGHDLRAFSLNDLRRMVGWVAQDPFLFSDTIAENIRFAAPKHSKDDVEKMARLVCLEKDEDAFPQGWETLIGERGVMVSGGQRQRIALARALMSRPRILLLDDTFAHLDKETESFVLLNVLEALPGSTILFTSHQVSSLKLADKIVILEDGRLLEEGPPNVLASRPGYFHMLCHRQELLRELDQFTEEQNEHGR